MAVIGHDVAAALPGLRVQAVSLMFDTARVERASGETVDDNGVVTSTFTELYEGPAKRQSRDGLAGSPEAGGATFTVTRYEAHFPVGAFEPRVGDRITWVTSRFDPFLPGKVDRVVSLLHKSAATAYRLGVEEGP